VSRANLMPHQHSIIESKLAPVLLFIAGFVSIAPSLHTAGFGVGFETMDIARNLASEGAFANPFSTLQTGPTAHTAPLYPAFVALLIRVLGYSGVLSLTLSGCSMAMHGLHAAFLPYVSGAFFDDRRPGTLAALTGIALPVFGFYPPFEIMYVAVGLMAFCLALVPLARRGGVWRGLSGGALAGVLALLNPVTVTITAMWLLFVLWRDGPERSRKFATWAVVGSVLTIAPWTWRNYRQFHMLIPIRDSLGLELYIANNDVAQASFSLNQKSLHLKHPNQSLEEATAVRDMGEAEYNRNRGAIAVAWIRTHPARFLRLAATRAKMFWLSEPLDAPWHRWSISGVTIASAAGLLILALRRRRVAVFISGVWLVYPLLYYCVEHDPRYRVPILWMTLLGAGYFWSSVWDISASRRRGLRLPSRPPGSGLLANSGAGS
jgi:hypothetical protein